MITEATVWVPVRTEFDRYAVDDFRAHGLTVSRTTLFAGRSTRGHRHPHAECIILTSGAARLLLTPPGADDAECIDLRAGEPHAIGPNVHHRVEAAPTGTAEFICFFAGDRGASVYGG